VATKAGKKKEIVSGKGLVLPRNKVYVTIGGGRVLKGKVRCGGS